MKKEKDVKKVFGVNGSPGFVDVLVFTNLFIFLKNILIEGAHLNWSTCVLDIILLLWYINYRFIITYYKVK